MAAQAIASEPPPMTPQQRLAIMLQPQSPTEILLSQSPHQKGVNWGFHDQATGQLRYVNVPYMDITGQQSVNPSAPQPMMAQQIPNQMSQQAQQMQSAQQLMNHVAQQLVIMTNTASVASPQQTLNVETQVDWSTKIAEVMREQFGLRPKQQSVMYKTPYPPVYNQIPSHTSTRCPTSQSSQGREKFLQWNMLTDSFYSWEKCATMMHSESVCSPCLCLDRPLLGSPLCQQTSY